MANSASSLYPLTSFTDNIPNTPGSVLSFEHLSYSVKSRKGTKLLVDDVSVQIRAGELLALMGPSGAGKSTLLDVMAYRKTMMEGGSIHLNGQAVSPGMMHKISTFVEQEDALLGVLTVRESVTYALRLHLPLLPRKQVNERVNRVLAALGLNGCADQKIGTPISRGISGGQKRRVTAACAMVTFPRILFLDEVTSGLDSTSAREVMAAIGTLSKAEGMIVIASIHQPSLETLAQFTNVMFLASGKTCYLGRVDELDAFFEEFGHPVPRFSSPSDHAMNFLNSDFAGSSKAVDEFRQFYTSWSSSMLADSKNNSSGQLIEDNSQLDGKAGPFATLFWHTAVLSERTTLNYLRNLLAYGVRVGMYGGMGLMLATIWIRLGNSDSIINDRLSVHFYSVAFLGFMSVAGIPSFLEERAVYYRESKNGLYSTLPFLLSNTLVNIPFLFISTIIFTVICYWAIGMNPGASQFFRFVIYLFLSIFAAESQALVVASLLPIFVAALAISAFMNGFWMSVGGYFIKARSLPRFWFYSFHYMDYQKYAFELMTNSDLRGLSFTCDTIINGTCACSYPSSTPDTCTVSGQDVLNYLDIGNIESKHWIGILISIVIIYRLFLFFALKTKSG
ncbi:ABC transporter G family member 11 [Psilocybe cubensis]|uniref:ABC transporter domain-containing protein n=2 Tax=Psilocybe cubensis TaxID=181762 RepID=A0A8H7XXV8_PSICU|nr:ABC transporter G family member 11 [Psilocybe cubensis]KAH9476836.1 ABC transporter G family member 11 [Psilocybe cubensis]